MVQIKEQPSTNKWTRSLNEARDNLIRNILDSNAKLVISILRCDMVEYEIWNAKSNNNNSRENRMILHLVNSTVK